MLFTSVKCLFSGSDDYFENLRETSVLACEMFTSGFHPRLKNVACLSSLMGKECGSNVSNRFLGGSVV